MAETDLQIVSRLASEQRQRILKQQTLVNSLKREGGERLAEATAFLNSMRDELRVLEDRLDRMVANA